MTEQNNTVGAMEFTVVEEHEDGSATVQIDNLTEEAKAVLIEDGFWLLLVMEAYKIKNKSDILTALSKAFPVPDDEEGSVPGTEYYGTPV